MMTVTNETRRSVMIMAWVFRRETPAKPFALCLKAAWAWTRKMAKAAAKMAARAKANGGRLYFGTAGALVPSATWNTLGGHRYRGPEFGAQSRMISRLGR